MAGHRSPLLIFLIFAPQFTYTSLQTYPEGHPPTEIPLSWLKPKAGVVETVEEDKDRDVLGNSDSQSDSGETGSTTLEKMYGDGDDEDSTSTGSSFTASAESEKLI